MLRQRVKEEKKIMSLPIQVYQRTRREGRLGLSEKGLRKKINWAIS